MPGVRGELCAVARIWPRRAGCSGCDGGWSRLQRGRRAPLPGGSFGNGAAMRVAPVGLLFHNERLRLWDQARLSALPTHLHQLGIEGAQLLALAVALCTEMKSFDRSAFFVELKTACQSPEYRSKL